MSKGVSTPKESPLMMRFRCGKTPLCGAANGGASLIRAPWPATAAANSSCSGG